MLMHQVNNGVY